ncbi:group III truncated hemoglobin [Streptomyces sp. NPDC001380]|uniref:group III truncated hemoglobin n=1 Tax=Streptomyces sp. NPDC001380 TaxID=3364566 RepID=UPI00369DD66B
MSGDGRAGAHPEAGRPDIRDRADVEALVAAFYGRALADPLIGPLFTEVARVDLAVHLPVMADFWEGMLLRPGAYRRNALRAHTDLHARSPLRADHFARWLLLWTGTVKERHTGPVARRAVAKATDVAAALLRRTAGGPGPGTDPQPGPRPGPVDVAIGPPPEGRPTS